MKYQSNIQNIPFEKIKNPLGLDKNKILKRIHKKIQLDQLMEAYFLIYLMQVLVFTMRMKNRLIGQNQVVRLIRN